jgi:hypothetical protein
MSGQPPDGPGLRYPLVFPLPPRAFGASLSLLLLSSCATQHSAQPWLPASDALNKEAGYPGPLVVMVGFQTGEKLPFLLDIGAPVMTRKPHAAGLLSADGLRMVEAASGSR